MINFRSLAASHFYFDCMYRHQIKSISSTEFANRINSDGKQQIIDVEQLMNILRIYKKRKKSIG
jgi:hypothetical protein